MMLVLVLGWIVLSVLTGLRLGQVFMGDDVPTPIPEGKKNAMIWEDEDGEC